jgi:ketosteroid isomerase-like protein
MTSQAAMQRPLSSPMPRAAFEAVFDAFFKAYAARDCSTVAPFLHDDVVWTISGPVDVLPFCGVYRGKADVVDLIGRKVPAVFRVFSFAPDAVLIDGGQAATLTRLAARRTCDGRVISYRVANFFRFVDGKLIENLSLLDSFDAVEQVIGHPLTVQALAEHDGLVPDIGDLVSL